VRSDQYPCYCCQDGITSGSEPLHRGRVHEGLSSHQLTPRDVGMDGCRDGWREGWMDVGMDGGMEALMVAICSNGGLEVMDSAPPDRN